MNKSDLVFGKYEIASRIAIGGMGEIFLARQVDAFAFDRLVILKKLLPELSDDDLFVSQFLDEARIAATLSHSNIVTIYEVGKWEGSYFIAMEYIRGGSVAEIISTATTRGTHVPWEAAARIAKDACLALDHAHHACNIHGQPLNIVHRDMSPQNVMVRDDGVTKLVDFGIAKAANRSTRTSTGDVKGKLSYMSPEQAMAAPLDGRSDQFSLGCVLWEAVTGARLFKGDNAAHTLARLLHGPIRRPRDERPDVPEALDAVVMRMIERKPEKRFARCREAADALQAYLDTTPSRGGDKVVAEVVADYCGQQIARITHAAITPSAGNFVFNLTTRKRRRLRQATRWGIPLVLVCVAAAGAWGLYAASHPGTPPATPLPTDFRPSTPPAPPPPLPSSPPAEAAAASPAPPRPATGAPGARRSHEARPGSKQPSPRSPAAEPGRKGAVGLVSISTTPWSVVFEGATLIGETPFFKKELPVGPHVLTFVNEAEGIRETRTVTVDESKIVKLDLTLK